MADIIDDGDFLVESGRASEGRMFVRAIHIPTQVSRVVVGLKGRSYKEVVRELLSAVVQEIEAAGWYRRSEERQEESRHSK